MDEHFFKDALLKSGQQIVVKVNFGVGKIAYYAENK